MAPPLSRTRPDLSQGTRVQLLLPTATPTKDHGRTQRTQAFCPIGISTALGSRRNNKSSLPKQKRKIPKETKTPIDWQSYFNNFWMSIIATHSARHVQLTMCTYNYQTAYHTPYLAWVVAKLKQISIYSERDYLHL